MQPDHVEDPDGNKLDFPVTITSIRPQKKRSARFSLYQEKTYLIGVAADTLVCFRLEKGKTLTASQFQEITRVEERLAAKEYMLRLLGRRDHSSRELQVKALSKGHGEKHIHNVIEELEQKGYLNNESFARQFASDKLTINRWGPGRVRTELRKKGIDAPLADRIIRTEIEDLELKEICVDLALGRRKHFSREADPFRRKQKIAAWLQRRGFDFTTIERALPEIIKQLNVS